MSTEVNNVTQVANPARATVRTALQILLGLAAGFALVAPSVIEWTAGTLQQAGYEELAGAVTAGSGTALLVSTVLARVMALPGVEVFLQNNPVFRWFAAAKAETDAGPADLGFDATVSGYSALDLPTDERLTIDGTPDSEPSADAIIYQEGGELPEPEPQDEGPEDEGPQHRAEDKGN